MSVSAASRRAFLYYSFLQDLPQKLGLKGAKSFYLPGIQGISTGMADFGETLK
jgi:hypothetical protein